MKEKNDETKQMASAEDSSPSLQRFISHEEVENLGKKEVAIATHENSNVDKRDEEEVKPEATTAPVACEATFHRDSSTRKVNAMTERTCSHADVVQVSSKLAGLESTDKPESVLASEETISMQTEHQDSKLDGEAIPMDTVNNDNKTEDSPICVTKFVRHEDGSFHVVIGKGCSKKDFHDIGLEKAQIAKVEFEDTDKWQQEPDPAEEPDQGAGRNLAGAEEGQAELTRMSVTTRREYKVPETPEEPVKAKAGARDKGKALGMVGEQIQQKKPQKPFGKVW